MAIQFACPSCGRKVQAPENLVGRQVRCPECKTVITVPAAELPAEEVAPPVPSPAPAPSPADEEGDRRPCPMCGEMIKATAVKCRYCGEIFDPELKKAEKKKKGGADAEGASMTSGDWVVAVLCPTIGCIASVIWMIQGKPKGVKMFGVSLLFGLLWGIVRVAITEAQKR